MLVLWGALLLTALIALGLGRWDLSFVSFATFALAVAPALLAKRYAITLPLPFLIATTLFVFASVFLGEAFGFYDRLWWWDIALHGSSAVAFGLFGFLFILTIFEGDRFAAPHVAICFLSFCLAMTVGSLWEIFEYGMDRGFGLNMQKSGLDDTMSDLIVDAMGASIGALSGYSYLKGRERRLLAPLVRQFVEANRRLYQNARKRIGR